MTRVKFNHTGAGCEALHVTPELGPRPHTMGTLQSTVKAAFWGDQNDGRITNAGPEPSPRRRDAAASASNLTLAGAGAGFDAKPSAGARDGAGGKLMVLDVPTPALPQFSRGWVCAVQTLTGGVKAKAHPTVGERGLLVEYSLCPVVQVVSSASELAWREATPVPGSANKVWAIVFPALADLRINSRDIVVIRVRATDKSRRQATVSSPGHLLCLSGKPAVSMCANAPPVSPS